MAALSSKMGKAQLYPMTVGIVHARQVHEMWSNRALAVPVVCIVLRSCRAEH